jgi:starch synthase (maltosyl-transferring)
MTGRLGIQDVTPVVDCGRFPAKAVVGERVPISATVFREGHDKVAANVVWLDPGGKDSAGPRPPGRARTAALLRMRETWAGSDRYAAEVVPTGPGLWRYRIEAWSDPLASWQHTVEVKVGAGQGAEELANDLEEGALLLEQAAGGTPARHRKALLAAAARLREKDRLIPERIGPALSPEVKALTDTYPIRELVTSSDTYDVWVDRERALYGSWYEFFPRSEGAVIPEPPAAGPPSSGTFATAAKRLPAIAAMGFDIVYLPPIHPIGKVNRKGRNNALVPEPGDVGSPWAIGSVEGGHDAIHPSLGTIEDFDQFVARANELGMEVALDFALNCAPDHPWVTEHPEWFRHRPDGSVAYSENPPKKYQDIYPLYFDADYAGLLAEAARVLRHWMSHGVRIFRVDNPHTKPINFWHDLLTDIRRTDPDVIFLSEAFTRLPMMHALAKRGFTQSYTYFTWKNAKWELEEYGRELVGSADFMRPNLFTNTPDILHEYLQYGGPPAFKIRAVLAATLSPSWGVYSGFELFEHQAVRPGSEEYLDSEKYQLRPRDWAAAEREGRSLAPYLAQLNHFRRHHPALHWLRNLHFHATDNDGILCYSKLDGDDAVIVVVNTDPHAAREATVSLDLSALGLSWDAQFEVNDALTGASYHWGQHNYVRLDPFHEPAHLLVVRRYDT